VKNQALAERLRSPNPTYRGSLPNPPTTHEGMVRFLPVLSGLLALLGCSNTSPSSPNGTAGSSGALGGSGGAPVQAGGSATAGTASGATGGAGASAGSGGMGTGTSGGGHGGAAGQGGSAGQANVPDVAFCTAALDAAALQLAGFRAAYTNPSSIPRSATTSGNVRLEGPADWTSGFVAGSFWFIYEYTQDEAFRSAAEARTAALEGEQDTTSHHDLGFQFMSSYGNGYRLTQNAAYPAVLKTAATSLSTRYNDTVGAIRSWDFGTWSFPVIVDNMMNLKLLYHVAKASGDDAFAERATKHAATTLANHFRPDHSSFHLVDYNPNTGAVVGKQTRQGLADDSEWARGQAWGLYGFTEAHGETGRADFLMQAENIASLLLEHPNLPDDKIPYWDYDAPDEPSTPRDASAAAVTASALLDLARYAAEPNATRYTSFALDILRSLSSPAYAAATGENSHFLLKHSVGSFPENSEIDVALNYADYYYLEALLRCRKLGKP
jgi:unsaturated chondroitin disaccharide hydrolase